jgi:uncharacterized RDD family membrane protein YckC
MSNIGLFCSQCGELNDADARFCRKCGASQPMAGTPAIGAGATSATAAPAASVPAPFVQSGGGYPPQTYGSAGAAYATPAPVFAAGEFHGYGGFWIRVLATIIDALILGVIFVPLFIILSGAFGLAGAATSGDQQAMAVAMLSIMPLLVGIPLVINWLYEAFMTSSSKQATLGHMVLHMKVVDSNGQRLSFGRATGRHFCKLLNNLTLYIGWLMVGFTQRKQGLHDLIVGTYMIKTR